MTPERALRSFTEKYSPEAIASLTELSGDISLTMSKFKGINLTEGAAKLTEYLGGFVDYKKEHVDDPEGQSNSTITEHTKSFVREQLFTETMIPYAEASSFVNDYLLHLSGLIGLGESSDAAMISADLDGESRGTFTEMVDDYLDHLTETVEPIVDRLLVASGYTGHQRLASVGKAVSPVKQPSYFL